MKRLPIPTTPVMFAIFIGGGFIIAGYNVTGMTIIALAFVILLFQRLQARRFGVIGLVGLAILITGFLAPAYLTASRVKDANELAIETKIAANVCPSYYGMNFIQKFNSDMRWCRSYPQYDPSQVDKAPAVETGDATASTTPNKLWK